MKNKTLNVPGLKDLNHHELKQVSGGFINLPVTAVVAIILSAMQNFEDIRHGFSDGYRGLPPRYLK